MTLASVTTLFEEARALPEGERSAYLDAACGGNSQLRHDVGRLLEHHTDAPTLFTRIAAGIERPSTDNDLSGERVGAYRLNRCIGHGGMGVVYLAERADGQFEQQVAIKLVRAAYPSVERRELFLRERQVLARLEHPGIARLLDGGVTGDGVPYFVMEYVDGVPLTDFVSKYALPVSERLQLFLRICSAVAHAHRHMVVHRDIKPGNVLVTSDGIPKLLDFGIAGPLDAGPRTASPRSGPSPATPAYASPEQLRGHAVTAASDVFSLGVVLREMLTGDRHPGQRRPENDLEWICARATEEDPARRYSSVEALSDDIARFLRHDAIRARPSSTRYRVARFVRRNRMVVAGGALVAGIAVLYLMAAVRQAQENTRQRRRAEVERDAFHHVASMLSDAISESNGTPPPGAPAVPLRQALDRSVERLDRELPPNGEIHGVILRTMAEAYERLGFMNGALGMARRSIDLLTAARGGEHPSVAGSWEALGGILLRNGCPVEADSALRRALVIQESQLKPRDPIIARTRMQLSLAAAALGSAPPSGVTPMRPGPRAGALGAGPPPGPPPRFGAPDRPSRRGPPLRPPVLPRDGPIDCRGTGAKERVSPAP